MTLFTPVKQVKPSDEIFCQLKEAILTHKIKSGEKLPAERELVEMFQVSRSAVREALRALEITGYIVIKQGVTGGAFVNDLTFERLGGACVDLFTANKLSLAEICAARLVIEPQIAQMAAVNADDEDIRRIQEAMAEEEKSPEYPEAVLVRSKTHYMLAEACGNRFLEAIAKSLFILTRQVCLEFEPPVEQVHPAGEHKAIYDAVVNRDAGKAGDEMLKHLQGFTARLIKAEENYRKT